MNARVFVLMFGASLWLGCQQNQLSKSNLKTSKSEIAVADGAQLEPSKMDTNQSSDMGKMTEIGPKIVQGTLYHSKGRMGELGGMLISPDFLLEGEGGNWKPEYEALVGKKVEASGVHFRYVCGPIEQCLEGGVIHYLQEIEYLKAVK